MASLSKAAFKEVEKLHTILAKNKVKIFDFLGEDNPFYILRKYLEARIELVKVESTEKIAYLVIKLIEVLVLLVFIAGFALFINLTAAFYLNEVLKSSYLGFLCVALFQLLVLILLWFNKNALARRIEKNSLDALHRQEDANQGTKK